MQQVVSTSTTPANNSAFATLQNNLNSNSNSDPNSNSNSNGDSNSNLRWNKKCICGLVHRFNDCYYIAEKKRPNGWRPNLDVQKEVEEKILSTP